MSAEPGGQAVWSVFARWTTKCEVERRLSAAWALHAQPFALAAVESNEESLCVYEQLFFQNGVGCV